MAIIEVADLVKVYREGDVRAVDGISLDVHEGEVFGFLGPNGAGKTTCLRIMTTLLGLTSGRVRVGGHDVTEEPAAVRRIIGVALQEVGLDDLSTGSELLRLQARLYGVGDPRARAQQLLELVGLRGAGDRRIGSYSGGMKRRLDLAAALVHQPRLLFLDEPTTGLDPASRRNVWSEVRRLNDAGTTIFLTTQYLEEADALTDRLAIIDEGRIVAEGSARELKAGLGEDVLQVVVPPDDRDRARELLGRLDGVERVEMEDEAVLAWVADGSTAIAGLVRRFDGAGIELTEVSLRQATLDDVFLQLTGHRIEGDVGGTADGSAVTVDGGLR